MLKITCELDIQITELHSIYVPYNNGHLPSTVLYEEEFRPSEYGTLSIDDRELSPEEKTSILTTPQGCQPSGHNSYFGGRIGWLVRETVKIPKQTTPYTKFCETLKSHILRRLAF
jgi:hypothetical protein